MILVLSFLWLVMGAAIFFWLAAVLFSIISRGFVYPDKGDNSPHIIFQITTRDCPETVDRAVESIRKSCGETGFTNYDIWVVTINSHPKLKDNGVRRVIVPDEFRCAAKYKARAMEFARRVRIDAAYNGWVYFIDEENWISGQTVKAISHFAACGNAKLASGSLVFNNGGSYLVWLSDSLRRAEARISYLQHSLGWWPVHGDNMLVHFEVEKEIGWEFKQLTEDVQFSGNALRRGYRTGWHGGELQTMSPASLADFIKQRRRWFRGMLQCIFSKGVGVKFKLLQAYLLLSGLTVAFIFIGIPADLLYGFTWFGHTWYYAIPVISIYAFSYFAGCKSNLKDKITAVLFSGIFSLFEGIGAWGSIIRPPKDFDIIKKT